MAKDTSEAESHPKRLGLLKDQVRSTKKKDSDRFEIVPIQNPLSFEKGFFVVIRACQLLAQNNDGMILVGIAGPSGAGKTIFTEKILNFMPSVATISMDNYNDSSRIVDGNFDGNVAFYVCHSFGTLVLWAVCLGKYDMEDATSIFEDHLQIFYWTLLLICWKELFSVCLNKLF